MRFKLGISVQKVGEMFREARGVWTIMGFGHHSARKRECAET